MTRQDCVYSATSIFRNFIGDTDVKVSWFNLMDYYENPDFPWFDHWLNEEEWSNLIVDYRKLDRMERWKARHYVSEYFPEHFLDRLKSFVEEIFNASVAVTGVSLPLAFKDRLTGKEGTPYLFMSSPSNTIFFEHDYEEDGLFFDLCGFINVDGTMPVEGIPDLKLQLRKYIRRIRRSRN